VRTVLQYPGRGEETATGEGVFPSLVAALEEETDRRAEPLDFAVLLPQRRLRLAGADESCQR
jgi:hypothetical protein